MAETGRGGSTATTFLILCSTTVAFLGAYYLSLAALPVHLSILGWHRVAIGGLASSFSAASLAARPLAGLACDVKEPTQVMAASMVLFLVVPLLLGFPRSVLSLALAQGLSGVTVGAFTVAAVSTVTRVMPLERAGEAMAWFSIALMVGKGFPPALGSWIYDRGGYFALLATMAGQAAVALFIVRVVRSRAEAPPDGSLERGSSSTEQNTDGAGTPFAWRRTVLAAASCLFTITLSFGGVITFLPLMAHERGIAGYGWFFVLQTALVVLTRMFSGRAVDRWGARPVVVGALVALSGSLAVLAFTSSLCSLLSAAVLYGLGYGASYPALSSTVVRSAPSASRGKAFGAYTAAQDLGVAVGAMLGGLSHYVGWTGTYLGMAGVILLSLLCTKWLACRGR